MRGILAVPTRLKAHAVHGTIHFRHSHNLRDLFRNGSALRNIDDFAAKTLCLRESFGNEIAYDDAGRAQQVAGSRAGQPDGPAAGDVDNRARANSSGDGTVIASG